MTNEEIERNIGFIIEQQAQFVVNLQKLEGNVEKIEKVQAKFSLEMQEVKDVLFTVVSMIGKLADAQRETDERLGRLGQETDERLGRLAEAQKRTDERLSGFIGALEKRFSGNGRVRDKRRKRPR